MECNSRRNLFCLFIICTESFCGFVFFNPVHRKEQRLCFSVVFCNISKGFSQAHVSGAFFTFMLYILLVLCYFLTDFCLSQLLLY